MNQTIQLLKEHKSSRSYTDEPVSDEMINEIVEAARCGASSMNGQQISLIVIKDQKTRDAIAEISWGQPWISKAPVFILVVVDFNRTALAVKKAGETQVVQDTLEGYTVGAVDAGITLCSLMTAARALGLGVVPIGALRNDSQRLVDLLKLPPLTFPMVGVCIGHIKNPAHTKPKMPVEGYRHDEYYHEDAIMPAIDAYDQTLMEYWQSVNRPDGQSWSKNTAGYYKEEFFPATFPVALKQGFLGKHFK